MSFDDDTVPSLQTEPSTGSATRGGLRASMHISSSANDDCERNGGVMPRHTRIGRSSPVLKRVRGLALLN